MKLFFNAQLCICNNKGGKACRSKVKYQTTLQMFHADEWRYSIHLWRQSIQSGDNPYRSRDNPYSMECLCINCILKIDYGLIT